MSIKVKKLVFFITMLLLITGALIYLYDFVKNIDFNKIAVNYIKTIVKDKLNGSIEFRDFKLYFFNKHLVLNVASIDLLDVQGNPVIKATNPKFTLSLRNLFSFTTIFKQISAQQVDIYISKDFDGWNYENLIKEKGKKPFKIQIRELDIPNCNINVKNFVDDTSYDHALKVYFKVLGIVQNNGYEVNIVSKIPSPLANGSLMIPGSSDELMRSNGKNLIRVNGVVDLSSWQNFLDHSNSLYVDLYEINDLHLELFNNLIFGAEKIKYRNFFNKYIHRSSLSLQGSIDESQNGSERNAKVKINVNNFAEMPTIQLDSSVRICQNLMINNFVINSSPSTLALRGEILDWRRKDPGLKLNLVFNNVDLNFYRGHVSELKTYIPDFMMQIFAVLHNSKYFYGQLDATDQLNSPKLQVEMPLVNAYTVSSGKVQSLKSEFKYSKDELLINSFELPVDFSRITMNGKYNLKNGNVDLNVSTEDLPLDKVKPIIAELPIFEKHKTLLTNSLIQGYTSFKARLKNDSKVQNTNNGILLESKVKLAGVNFVTKDYPLNFSKLNADLELDNKLLKIINLNSMIDGDYIEARGEFDLKDTNKLNLEFAAPRLNSATLIKSRILNYIPKKNIDLNYAEGDFKDIYLTLSNTGSGQKLTGKMNFDNVDLVVNNLYEFYDIKGDVGINNNSMRFDGFSFFLGEESNVKATGNYDFTGNGSQLKVTGQKVNFVDLASLIDPGKKWSVDPKGGFVDFDLVLKGKNASGKVVLDKVDFLYKGLKFIKYPFFDIQGSLILDKNVTLTNASGFYGSSNFNNLYLNIRNLKSTGDKFVDLKFQGNVLVDEYFDIIPSGIQKMLRMKGTLPLTLAYSGNKQKKTFDIDADLDKLTYFKFAEWLDLSKKYNAKLKSKLVVTPQLMVSDNCQIIVTNPTNASKTVINSVYQIKDWSVLNDLSYYLNFTSQGENSELYLLEPSIISLRPMNLDMGPGRFICDTYGNNFNRQTICDFKIAKATAKKYGIGDLHANSIDIGLLSIANKPLDVEVAINNGDWNTIPYKKLDFDLRVNGDYIYVNNLKTRVVNGRVRANTVFNYKTLESSFNITGHRMPAHDLVQGIWGLGDEVPEGVISGTLKGSTQGVLPDPMFYNFVGTVNLLAKNGKLSSLRSMQKILTAVNTLRNFDVNNVFQILVTFKGGLFNDMITSLKYDHGKISTERALLKAEQIEMDMNGFVDFKTDQLWISGKGLIPKHSKSILQTVGVGAANLGNLLSMGTGADKRFFEFKMIGPVTDMNKSAESLKSNFKWL